MKTTLTLIFALVASCCLYGQGLKNLNIKDPKKGQVNIPGTHVFLTPPIAYEIATNFTGLKCLGYSIMISEETLTSYDSVADMYVPELFTKNGMTVYSYADTMVAGYHAKLFHTGNVQNELYMLIFGNSSFCVTVNGLCPPGKADTARELRNKMLTVRYDGSLKVDPLAAAPFILDTKKSKYKFFGRLAGVYYYSTDSITRANGQLMTVAVLPADALTRPQSVSEQSIRQLVTGSGFIFKEYRNVSTARVNDYETYEADVYGELGGKNITFYQFAVVYQDNAVLMQGLAPEDYDKTVVEFKKLAHTISFR